jgi:hypothetical protein
MTSRRNVKHKVYVDLIGGYVTFDSDPRMSEFHKWMIFTCYKILEKSKTFRRLNGHVEIVAVKDFNYDNRLPDVYTPFFDIECETGLKYHYDDLKARILSTHKTVVVVVPNERVKVRYVRNVSVRKEHLKICTLGEFQRVVSIILQNVKGPKNR